MPARWSRKAYRWLTSGETYQGFIKQLRKWHFELKVACMGELRVLMKQDLFGQWKVAGFVLVAGMAVEFEAAHFSRRRGTRGTSRSRAPWDRPWATLRSSLPHANPGTTPTRSRACHKTPRRWASSRPAGASCPRSLHHTRHIRAARPPRPRSKSASYSPRRRHTPTGPPWASEIPPRPPAKMQLYTGNDEGSAMPWNNSLSLDRPFSAK